MNLNRKRFIFSLDSSSLVNIERLYYLSYNFYLFGYFDFTFYASVGLFYMF